MTAIHGDQRPQTVRSLGGGVGMMGGRAEFDIVFLSGSFSRRLPECILRGMQWRILDRPGSEAEIAVAVANAEAVERQHAADTAAADAAHETELARLRAAPEHAALRQGDERHGGKLAAANIRVELRRAFPGVKFSVRVPHHGSIHIRWTSGPTRQEVEAIANRYQGGHFDGMEDIYRSARSAGVRRSGASTTCPAAGKEADRRSRDEETRRREQEMKEPLPLSFQAVQGQGLRPRYARP